MTRSIWNGRVGQAWLYGSEFILGAAESHLRFLSWGDRVRAVLEKNTVTWEAAVAV